MVLRIATIILCLIYSGLISAQQINSTIFKSYGLANSLSTEIFDNNGGLQLEYQSVERKLAYLVTTEFRTIDWGNQVSIGGGASKTYWSMNKFALSQNAKLLLHLPLFYNDFLLGYGAETNLLFTREISKRWLVGVSAGLRYDSLPSYRQYGPINWTSEAKFGVQFSYLLHKREEK